MSWLESMFHEQKYDSKELELINNQIKILENQKNILQIIIKIKEISSLNKQLDILSLDWMSTPIYNARRIEREKIIREISKIIDDEF